jgi:ESCRT-II complex subunit VPS36
LLQLDAADHEVELSRTGPCELRWEGAEYDGQPMSDSCPSDAVGPWNSKQSNLTVALTTHRLVLLLDFKQNNMTTATTTSTAATSTMMARFIHLSNVHSTESKGGPSLLHPNASYKLVITTFTYGDLILSWGHGTGGAHSARDNLASTLETTLARKAWEVAARFQQEQRAQKGLTSRKVGVDHILTKHKLKHRQAAHVADKALSGDAEQLLEQASALLQVIQSYTTLLNNHNNSSQQQQHDKNQSNAGRGGEEQPDEDFERLSSLLQDMGMTSGLTKDHFGGTSSGSGNKRGGKYNNNSSNGDSAYYEWLARQVVDFLHPRLPAMGGVISLTDVYCLFNRARGTNLISPEDLRTACDLLSGLQLPISQKVFSTGIVVLQLEDCIPSSSTLIQLCPTTALQASHVLHLSPLLALEQLQDAEQAGWLCRDTTLETTVFYPNRFSEWI